ncbi:MAG: D-alanyl-lipoteichoic acid biosynthesis protein DltD [Gemmatimonadota bacterium]
MTGAGGSASDEPRALEHVFAAGWATLLLMLAVAVLWRWGGGVVSERGHEMTGASWPPRNRGTALLRASLTPRDVVPLLGTSELIRQRVNRPDEFFASRPTGFRVVAIGAAGMVLVEHALAIGAVSGEVRGRKVGVLLSPGEVTLPDTGNRQKWFSGNYSRSHAAAVFVDDAFPDSLARDIARRLVKYKGLSIDPVIETLVRFKAADGLAARAGAMALAPAARLDAAWIALVDRMEGAMALRRYTPGKMLTPTPQVPLDWARLDAVTRADYALESNNNKYGFENAWWAQFKSFLDVPAKPEMDERHRVLISTSPSWGELELLVRAIRSVGAQPVLLPMPLAGTFLGDKGVRADTRADYYDRLDAFARAHGVAMQDVRPHDLDRLYLHDQVSHLSSVGWLAVDRALDAFVHDSLAIR